MFSYDSKLSTWIRKGSEYLLINLLLLIGCLPVLTTGTAFSAAYTTLLENQMRGRGYLIQTFWCAFKQNLKPGTLIGSLYFMLMALFAVDSAYFNQRVQAGQPDGLLYILFAVLLLLLALLFLYTFAYLARFKDTVLTTIRNAAVVMLSHPWQNIQLLLLFLIVAVGIYLKPLLILILPILYLRMAVEILEKIFARYLCKDDWEREQENGFIHSEP